MKKLFSSVAVMLILVSTFATISIVKADSSEVINKLAVPYMYQGHTYWCFLNSVSMVLQYYGVRVHAWDVAQAWNLGHDEGSGNPLLEIIFQPLQNFVRSKGLTVDTPVKKSIWNFQFYKNHIDAGEPVILCGFSTSYWIIPTGGHAVVIAGYKSNSTGDYLLIHDPSGYFVAYEWKDWTEAPRPYMYAVAPWTKVMEYFGNLWNLILMYDIVIHGSPKPPGGAMCLIDGGIYHTGAADYGNNGQLYLSNTLTWTSQSDEKIGGGEEILADETIVVRPIIMNQYSSDRTYTVKVTLKSEASGQNLAESTETLTVYRQRDGRPFIIVDLASLAHVDPGIYDLTISLWGENPNYTVDVPYDVLGPFSLTIASGHAENDLNAFQNALVLSGGSLPMRVDIKARASAYLHVSSSGWSWSLYADAYMIDVNAKKYADTGRTGLDFEVNAYDPNGGRIYTGSWKSTDTDGDGMFGDFSGSGGATPSVQSPVDSPPSLPQYIILRMKWKIYDYFALGWKESAEIEAARLTAPTPFFEDGFESGNFGRWTGTSVSGGETATVVSTLKHHGIYSGRFASNGGGGTEYAYSYKTMLPSTELYARGYFYVSKSGIVDNNDSFYLVLLRAGSNNVAYAGWRKTSGVVKWFLTVRSGTSSVTAYSTTTPSVARWYCVELYWKKDSVNGLGELWVDGTRVCSLTGRNTAAYGDVTQTRFGLAQLSYCASTTAYSDCIKIARSYIGLEPKVNSFTVSPNPFSPNGDGTKDTATIKAYFNVAVNWNLQIRSSSGTVLRTWTGTGKSLSLVWDGKNSTGFKVPDGSYAVRLSGTGLSGVTFTTKSVTATVDTKLPTITGVSVYPTTFYPRSGQTTKISYTLSESCYVTIKVYNSGGTLVRTLMNNALQSSGAKSITWNGKTSSGTTVSAGTYTIRIYVVDKAGNKATPYPIIKTVTVK